VATTPPVDCTGDGKEKRHMKVSIRLACGGGAALRLRGKLNPGTATIGGHFVYAQGGRVRAGKFSLTKQAG